MLPLSFDRVANGQPITSPLPMFRLPIELLSHVTPYLSPADLASLALVDRDCRQFARSIQFCEVKMGASDASLEFLNLLEVESRDRRNSKAPPGFTIGSCVRRVSICYDQAARSSRFGTSLDDLMFLTLADRKSRLSKEEALERGYLDRICVVVRDALPNLYRLDWDLATISSQTIHCFTSTPIKHLGLNNVRLDDVFMVRQMENTRFWALESLVLNITWPPDRESNEGSAPFLMSMLYQAAPTLTNLIWNGRTNQCYAHSFSEPPPRFPNLRALTLESVRIDERMLSALLGPLSGVASLSIDVSHPETRSFLQSHGYLPSLTHLDWITETSNDYSSMTSFIANNTQLESLTMSGSLPSATLDGHILPLLPSFSELTTLRLAWVEDVICPEALQLIGSIVTLQHLWLSAGHPSGWRHTWQVDHTALADALAPLTALKTLCLFRDTYTTDVHPLLDPSPEGYYVNRNLPQADDVGQYLDAEDRTLLGGTYASLEEMFDARGRILRQAWERWHRECMAAFAAGYAGRLSGMTMCYLGQIPFGVGCCGEARVVSALEDRDYSPSQLKKLWERVV